jgi:predicted component of type VI protein secretion system
MWTSSEKDRARRELLDLFAITEANPSNEDFQIPLVLGALADMAGKLDSALYWYQRSLGMARPYRTARGWATCCSTSA